MIGQHDGHSIVTIFFEIPLSDATVSWSGFRRFGVSFFGASEMKTRKLCGGLMIVVKNLYIHEWISSQQKHSLLNIHMNPYFLSLNPSF